MASRAIRVPVSFWVIAGLSLLWNAYGAFDYTMTQLDAEAVMGQFSAEERAYLSSFPAWHTAFWALGVWGSTLGSVLLLARSRWAVASLLVSLLGLTVTTIFTATRPMPASLGGPGYWGVMVVVWIVLLALLWYSRRALARGYIA